MYSIGRLFYYTKFEIPIRYCYFKYMPDFVKIQIIKT